MKVPNYFMEMDSRCGCVMPDGCRGSQGWHLHQTQHPITGADQVTAYERCPAYWRSVGFEVDPFNRTQLLPKEQSRTVARIKA